MQAANFDEIIERIVANDPRYHRDAYGLVREALDHTQKVSPRPKRAKIHHVTGQELLTGIREFALQQYGPMALTVLETWGVRRCEDIGEIVFNMVESGLLAKTEKDSRADFKSAYDFHDAFRKPFLPTRRTPPPSSRSRSKPNVRE